jgi:hypothetical protein
MEMAKIKKGEPDKKVQKEPPKTPPKVDLTDEELGTVCGGGDTVSSECGCARISKKQM